MSTRAPRRAWRLFVGGSLLMVVAAAASSVALLRTEAREHERGRVEAQDRELRSAAAAMDRWLGPVLAREAGRHHADYAAYRAPRRLFSSELERLPTGAILEPSPLLGYRADTIPLHVEWTPEGGARSPQVPLGRQRELALASGLPEEALRASEERLASFVAATDFAALADRLRAEAPAPPPTMTGLVDAQSCLAPDEQREGPTGPGLVEDAGQASVGPLVPLFLGGETLVLARDVRAGSERRLQVAVVDWPVLAGLLLEQAAGSLGGARLSSRETEGVALSTLPVRLAAEAPAAAALGGTPLRTRLVIAWSLGLAALAVTGWSLRSGLLETERRARLAAAMSHELRTPLTTLRMYSEMLAEGVVTDPAVRQEYLETLQAESARLASLVENVLLHARVEKGSPRRRQRLTIGELIASVEPVLSRRAAEDRRPLRIDVELDESTQVEVDREAVERVLFNLVDNACKHAVGAEDPSLHLAVRRRGRHVDLELADHGPGIPRSLGSAVFEAFRRGDESSAPGVGLGLSLSRALARDLSGELSLVPTESGARFRLSLRLG